MQNTKSKTDSHATWDVFLSHNSRQKAFVAKVAAQWRGLGLDVFFDKDSIRPGEDVTRALGEALEYSRTVVLLITPDAFESVWVSMEMSSIIYADPDARGRRLIPVMLMPTPNKMIPLPVRRLNCVDLTDVETRQERYHSLLHDLLKSKGRDFVNLPDLPSPESDDAATVGRAPLEVVLDDGPVPLGSPYYIDRDADRVIRAHFRSPGVTVTVRGHWGSGKSSLISRQHAWAIASGRASCVLDFWKIGESSLKDSDALLREVVGLIVDGLDLPGKAGPGVNTAPRSALVRPGPTGPFLIQLPVRTFSRRSAPGTTLGPTISTTVDGAAWAWLWRTQRIRPFGSVT
jgi:hypothetical protein